MGAVSMRGLGKAYRRFASNRDRALELATLGGIRRHQLSWVFRGLDLDVAPGEAVGIVGRNGAGKSTLLKLLTGTTAATEGTVSVQGRVAALLELGMGLHPEFTGRQNVALAGLLLGFSQDEVEEAAPRVESFAELGEHFDWPVKAYSSGMQLRLGFSIATAVRPDILIVDEALAVGDAYFQLKCIGRIRAMQQEGTTLLFVSHDPAAVRSLCTRAVLLESGRVAMDGRPDTVLENYHSLLMANVTPEHVADNPQWRSTQRYGSGSSRIEETLFVDADTGERLGREIPIGKRVTLLVRGSSRHAIDGGYVGFVIRDRLGNEVFGVNTMHLGAALLDIREGQAFEARFSFPMNLGLGAFGVSVAILGEHAGKAQVEWIDNVLTFQVSNPNVPAFVGTVWLPVSAELELGP